MRYLRQYVGQESEAIPLDVWLDVAQGAVYDVKVALAHGFWTREAYYWAEA